MFINSQISTTQFSRFKSFKKIIDYDQIEKAKENGY